MTKGNFAITSVEKERSLPQGEREKNSEPTSTIDRQPSNAPRVFDLVKFSLSLRLEARHLESLVLF